MRLLKEQVVPFANRFTYPFALPPSPPFDQPLAFLFIVSRDNAKRELEIVGAIFITGEVGNGDGDGA
jgi:hypothetical protein